VTLVLVPPPAGYVSLDRLRALAGCLGAEWTEPARWLRSYNGPGHWLAYDGVPWGDPDVALDYACAVCPELHAYVNATFMAHAVGEPTPDGSLGPIARALDHALKGTP
jgi:hypothetical protein